MLIETLSSRGRLSGATATSPATPASARRTPSAPPARREQERLDEELADQPPARRAERAPNGELPVPRRRLRQEQVRHVRARDQEQEPDRAQQDQQRRARRARERVLERHGHPVLEQIVALLVRLFVDPPRDRADVAIRLRDRHAVAQARDRAVVVRRPARVLAVQLGGHPEIGLRGETEPGRQHADDGKDRSIDLQVRLRKVLRRSEVLPPVAIADEDGGSRPLLRVAGGEIPPEDRLDVEDLQEAGRHVRHVRPRRLQKPPRRT